MHEQFEIVSFLNTTADAPQNGRVHILADATEWCLDIVEGRVLFAAHSLQYLMALESILPNLGYEAALPLYRQLTQYLYRRNIDAHGLEPLSWTSKVIGTLVNQNALTLQQAEKVLAKLTEDAVESLLGLDAATVTRHPIPAGAWYAKTNGTPIASLQQYLSVRQQEWKTVCDRIYSPHQRPYCEKAEDIYRPVPQGLLSQQMLEALTRLMQGATIRQLAQSIKQDEAKLAKLLYPYIEHRVIKLWSPVPPFDRLPWLPGAKLPAAASTLTPVVPNTLGTTPQPSVDRQLTTTSDYAVSSSSGLANGNGVSKTSGFVTKNQPSTTNRLTVNQSASNQLVAKQSDADGLTNNGGAESGSAESRYLIVCIDDSQAMLEQIENYLDSARYELKTIIDPVASVSKICAMKPDLVLMDISMPSISGNSLCQILKRSYMFKDVPIIMISGNASPLNKATAQSSGATDYLEKPFSKEQLMKVLERHLETSVS